MIRVLFDTNVFISALLFGGLPTQLLHLALTGRFKLVTSPILLEELLDKLRTKFRRTEAQVLNTQLLLEEAADIISTTETLHIIKADPDDDRVLECALAGQADYIVSGDRHLLDLAEFREIPILTVRQFMDKFDPKN